MDAKKLTLIILLLFILGVPYSWAGSTTISGTTSCVMPDLFGFNTQPAGESAKTQQPQAPIPSGASGNYEVQKEEKLLQTEKTSTSKNDAGKECRITVYTICAK